MGSTNATSAHRVKEADGLEALNLTTATVSALQKQEIETVGQLWRRLVYGKKIPGIGTERAGEIREQLAKAGFFVYKPWTENLLQDLFDDPVDRKYVLTPAGEGALIDRLLLWLTSDSPNSWMWLVALRYSIGEFRWSNNFKVLNKRPVTEDGRYTFPAGPMRAKKIASACDLSPHEVRKELRAAKAKLLEHEDEIREIYTQYRLVLE